MNLNSIDDKLMRNTECKKMTDFRDSYKNIRI